MEKITYKELDNLYFPSIFDVMNGTFLELVKQTYHFGDTGLREIFITVDI
jgi:hypothetical protein